MWTFTKFVQLFPSNCTIMAAKNKTNTQEKQVLKWFCSPVFGCSFTGMFLSDTLQILLKVFCSIAKYAQKFQSLSDIQPYGFLFFVILLRKGLKGISKVNKAHRSGKHWHASGLSPTTFQSQVKCSKTTSRCLLKDFKSKAVSCWCAWLSNKQKVIRKSRIPITMQNTQLTVFKTRSKINTL